MQTIDIKYVFMANTYLGYTYIRMYACSYSYIAHIRTWYNHHNNIT